MEKQIKESKHGPEAAGRLDALFARWAREEAERDYDSEPLWEEVKRALNQARPAAGKPFADG